MNMLMRLIASAPKNMTFPLIAVLAGWYGGAKYGAPEFVMNSVDGMLAKGGDIVGGLLTGGEGEEEEEPLPAPAPSGSEV